MSLGPLAATVCQIIQVLERSMHGPDILLPGGRGKLTLELQLVIRVAACAEVSAHSCS